MDWRSVIRRWPRICAVLSSSGARSRDDQLPPSGLPNSVSPNGLARSGRFLEPDQCDLGSPVPFAKIFRFTRRANHLYKFAPSHPTRGAYHDRHGRGAGCGGRGSVLRATGLQGRSKRLVSDHQASGRETLQRTAKSCGPDAPTLASSSRMFKSALPGADKTLVRGRRWQTSPVTGESTKETVKTIACGNAG